MNQTKVIKNLPTRPTVTIGEVKVIREGESEGIIIYAQVQAYVSLRSQPGTAVMQYIRSGGVVADYNGSEEYYDILAGEEKQQLHEILDIMGVKE